MTGIQTKTLPLQAAYDFGIEKGLSSEIEGIRNMVIEWDRSYTSSLRRGYVVELFEENGIFEEFKQQHWANGFTRSGETMRNRFLRIRSEYQEFLAGTGGEDGPEEEDLIEQAFAAESDLRDFLAMNLELIEPGLTLFEQEGRNGLEYPIEGGRIDILGVDTAGKYVVVELKLSKGRKKTVGQLVYYMAWVDENLGNEPCRGVIVARDIPDDLILATKRVEGVSLFEYQLQVSLSSVALSGEAA